MENTFTRVNDFHASESDLVRALDSRIPLSRSFSANKLNNNCCNKSVTVVCVNSLYGCFRVPCHEWNSILDIKVMFAKHLRSIADNTEIAGPNEEGTIPTKSSIEPSMIRMFFAGKELSHSLSLCESGISSDSSVYAALCSFSIDRRNSHVTPRIQPWGEFNDTKSLYLVSECANGFSTGFLPNLCADGSAGTYFLKNGRGTTIAVFKPDDEEPRAPNNPRGIQGKMFQQGLRQGILSGEASLREVAAYLLDHQGFAGVPFTTRVEALNDSFCYNVGSRIAKAGSLQEYVKYDDMACDLAPQKFCVDQVHKIAILDIRLVNTDRNDQNLLACKNQSGSFSLIPIDHGYCLPDSLQIGWCDWCWLNWPQAKIPFSQDILDYIFKLDIRKDIQILRNKLSIREGCLRLMEICHNVLLEGAKAGLTLFEIGSIISRDKLCVPSLLEITIAQATVLSASKKNKEKSLVRSRSMFSCCSKCINGFVNAGEVACENCCSEYPQIVSYKDSYDVNPALMRAHCAGNFDFTPKSDEIFWSYFEILLEQVIRRRKESRCKRRSSCV